MSYREHPDYGAPDLHLNPDGTVRLAPGFEGLRQVTLRHLRRQAIEDALELQHRFRRHWSRGLSLWIRRWTRLDISRQALARGSARQLGELILVLSLSDAPVPRA